MSGRTIEGGCLCGAIRYTGMVDTATTLAVHCHCNDCQRATGSGGATVVAVPEASLLLDGSPRRYTVTGLSGGRVHRDFCARCGSPLLSAADLSPGLVFIKAGSLDDSGWLQPAMNCWTSSRPEWAPLDERLPSSPGNPEQTITAD
ncbi:MAG: GFA family protein [Pseudomonadota bacterium]